MAKTCMIGISAKRQAYNTRFSFCLSKEPPSSNATASDFYAVYSAMPPRARGRGQGGEGSAGRGRGGAGPAQASQQRGGGRGGGGGPRGGGGNPPRGAGGGGGGWAPRGGGRGGGAGGGSAPPSSAPATALSTPPSGVQAMGVIRPGFGTVGKAIKVLVNALPMPVPEHTVYHYDVAMDKTYRPKFNTEIVKQLQDSNRDVFLHPAPYDGKKNLYTIDDYGFENGGRSFDVVVQNKVYKVKLTHVRTIDPTTLDRYTKRQQSWDENVATTLAALNVAIKMHPASTNPSRGRTFYSLKNRRPVGGGLEVTRGYFQSIRPTFDKLLINIDIATGVTYRAGALIDMYLEFLALRPPINISSSLGTALSDYNRLKAQRFSTGVSVLAKSPNGDERSYGIYKLTKQGADTLRFQRDGVSNTVASYFAQSNRPLRFPKVICIETKRGTYIPLECCTVPPGQVARCEVDPDIQRKVVEFATQSPSQRLSEIKDSLQLFAYGQSEYVRAFGMEIDPAKIPLEVGARILDPPAIQYKGQGNATTKIVPRFGSWNMIGKKFMFPARLSRWIIVCFVDPRAFNNAGAQKMKDDFVSNCRAVGIQVEEENPAIAYGNPGTVEKSIMEAAKEYMKAKQNSPPQLVVCVMPDSVMNRDIYRAIKFWGDMKQGVATQCILMRHARASKPQYWANVLLKVNVKLGGKNSIPESNVTASALFDVAHPTMIMGADVMHPAPGSDSPSYAAVVGSVDSSQSFFLARTQLQSSRQEMIVDLKQMSTELIQQYIARQKRMERLIFFRDGVSEGEFSRVLEHELPLLKEACTAANVNPKITFIIVGKRHHFRFFPTSETDPNKDIKSGNLPAGTVIDREITSPIEYDFYLQSHAGLLGTSRSSHYTVVCDENAFNPNQLQMMAYTLCHVYARSTRAVSIPAPVYYAHIVCSRAKTHYDPAANQAPSVVSGGTSSSADNAAVLDVHRQSYRSVHANQNSRMYFM
ncbi:argonaute-like protein [Mucidula mucida]|nr:argonaute-like protein [Mucidula mucida]